MNIKTFTSESYKESNNTLKVFSQQIKTSKGTESNSSFFGFIESGHPGQDYFINQIVKVLSDTLTEAIKNQSKKKFDNNFETALQDANKRLTNFIQDKNILMDFDTLNGAVVVMIDNSMYFSYLGKAISLMIHQAGKNNYKIINILENVSGSAIKPSVFKVFSNIISGQVGDNDYLFFAPIQMMKYLNNDEIEEIIIDSNLDEAINQIKNHFSEEKNLEKLGGVIISMQTDNTKTTEEETEEIKNNILDQENDDEDEEEYDEIIEDINQDDQEEDVQEEEEEEEEEEKIVDDFEQEKENHNDLKKKYQDKIREDDLATKKDLQKQKKTIYSGKSNIKIEKNRKNFFTVKRISQLLLLVAIISAIFFGQSLWEQKDIQDNVKQEELYNQSAIKIEDLLARIESFMIIKKNDEALETIKIAKSLISALPGGKNKRITELEQKIDVHLDIIRKATNVLEPNVVAELANPAEHIILQKNDLYLYNSDNSIYKVNLDNNSVKAIAINVEDAGSWQKNVPDFDEGKTLLFYNGNGLSQYDFSTNELSNVKIDISADVNVDDLFFYGQKLYLIDGKKGQIYKYTKQAQNSFGSVSSWLTKPTPMTDIVSMAIDGNIWAMQKNGKLLKFFKNKKKDFQLDTVDPPLVSPNKIYTSFDYDKIFILEPANNRLVIFNKNGKLESQYFSKEFNNLTDFVVTQGGEGEGDTVYLMNRDKVFEITVE